MAEQNLNGPDRVPGNIPENHLAPEDHLAHLLPPASIEKPWFLEIFKNIKELINPPKLPPLEITSKPVPIHEITIYAGNEAKSGFLSLAIHVGVIALLVFIGSLKPVQKMVKQVTGIEVDLRPYIAQNKKQTSGGGGGGGARELLNASKGKLPKPAPRQLRLRGWTRFRIRSCPWRPRSLLPMTFRIFRPTITAIRSASSGFLQTASGREAESAAAPAAAWVRQRAALARLAADSAAALPDRRRRFGAQRVCSR